MMGRTELRFDRVERKWARVEVDWLSAVRDELEGEGCGWMRKREGMIGSRFEPVGRVVEGREARR
jgi:hypothetical protein